MSAVPYTYSVIRYVHDPAVGETLNVGVVLYAPTARYVGTHLEYHYERLSNAFSGFDGNNYRRILRQFESAVDRLRSDWSGTILTLKEPPSDVGGVAALVWPDTSLSFQFGPVLAGLSHDLDVTLDSLFSRMVPSHA